MASKQVVWTISLTTDGPIDQDRIVKALAEIGKAEVTNYKVKAVK